MSLLTEFEDHPQQLALTLTVDLHDAAAVRAVLELAAGRSEPSEFCSVDWAEPHLGLQLLDLVFGGH